jgi:hypothetical protein
MPAPTQNLVFHTNITEDANSRLIRHRQAVAPGSTGHISSSEIIENAIDSYIHEGKDLPFVRFHKLKRTKGVERKMHAVWITLTGPRCEWFLRQKERWYAEKERKVYNNVILNSLILQHFPEPPAAKQTRTRAGLKRGSHRLAKAS